jgi:chemotaxis protein CheX
MNQIPKEMLSVLIESTKEVFETMVFQPLGPLTPIEGDALRPRSNVVGTVAFAGEQCGIVAFYSTTATANLIAGAMLGIAAEDVNGEMPDAIGEITNMIAGTFRTKMAANGPRWAISIPTVTMGSDFYTKYVTDVKRTLCAFTLECGDEVFVELILTKNNWSARRGSPQSAGLCGCASQAALFARVRPRCRRPARGIDRHRA